MDSWKNEFFMDNEIMNLIALYIKPSENREIKMLSALMHFLLLYQQWQSIKDTV